MTTRCLSSLRAGAAFLLILGVGGCANFANTTSGSAALQIEATTHSIYQGEIVTVTTRSLNTLGSKASIEWTSTGGKLETEQNGRIARVKFDEPGVFTITAKLMVDGRVVDTEQENITVRPLVTYDK